MFTSLSYRRDRRGGLILGLLCFLVVAGIAGGIGYKYYLDTQSDLNASQLITTTAVVGPFDHVVAEQGEIGSSSKTDIVCQVKSRGSGGVSILWVIPEGTHVQPGEKLVELDSSELEVQLKAKKILVISAGARVTTASAVVEQAKIARQEYLEGVFLTEEKTLLSEQAISEQNLLKAKLAIASSERLVAKGLIKSLQLDADRYAVSNAQNKLDADTARLRVLRDLTKKKMLVQFDSDIEAAVASLSAAQSELLAEETELKELEDQMAKCVMYAPSAGVVVYANKYSGRGGSAEFVVEAGSTVREQQTILYLPDPSKMQVECKINESRITLIEAGMPARITVDAVPGMRLNGRVSKVNRYAEPGGWMSSSTKEYATFVDIIDPPQNIRTGMTANVQIYVEQLDHAVQIPIQGLYEHGGDLYSLKQTSPGKFETVRIKLGATNDTTASIEEGLAENDRVVLNLREHLDRMDLPEVETDDTSEMRALRTVSKPGAVTEGSGEGEAQQGIQPAANRTARAAGQPGLAAAGQAERGQADGGPADGGPGERGPGGRGPAGGPGGGGGQMDVNALVASSMERNDSDRDGSLSAEEIGKMDSRFQSLVSAADSDGDGNVSRAELTSALKARFSGGGAR